MRLIYRNERISLIFCSSFCTEYLSETEYVTAKH